MKKLLFTLAGITFFTLAASAQTKKGDKIVGVSFGSIITITTILKPHTVILLLYISLMAAVSAFL